nr:MAG TPA: hypothetical protein [Caudoviricetes sp.]
MIVYYNYLYCSLFLKRTIKIDAQSITQLFLLSVQIMR